MEDMDSSPVFIMNNKECRVRSALNSLPLIIRVKSVHKNQGENILSTSSSIKIKELVHTDTCWLWDMLKIRTWYTAGAK